MIYLTRAVGRYPTSGVLGQYNVSSSPRSRVGGGRVTMTAYDWSAGDGGGNLTDQKMIVQHQPDSIGRSQSVTACSMVLGRRRAIAQRGRKNQTEAKYGGGSEVKDCGRVTDESQRERGEWLGAGNGWRQLSLITSNSRSDLRGDLAGSTGGGWRREVKRD